MKNKSILVCFMLFLIAGCQSIDVRGQYVSDEVIQEINKKTFSKEDVVDKIGNPTYIPEYTQDTWYYIQRSQTKRAWFDPKVVEQRIIKITFDNKGKTVKAELMQDTQDENIKASGEYIKSRGTEQSGVQKFVKNMGRFTKTSTKKNKKKTR